MRFRYLLVRASMAGSFVFPIHATLIFTKFWAVKTLSSRAKRGTPTPAQFRGLRLSQTRKLYPRRSESHRPLCISPSLEPPQHGWRANLFPPPFRSWDETEQQPRMHNQKLPRRFPATSRAGSGSTPLPHETRNRGGLSKASQARRSEKDRRLPRAEGRRRRGGGQSASWSANTADRSVPRQQSTRGCRVSRPAAVRQAHAGHR